MFLMKNELFYNLFWLHACKTNIVVELQLVEQGKNIQILCYVYWNEDTSNISYERGNKALYFIKTCGWVLLVIFCSDIIFPVRYFWMIFLILLFTLYIKRLHEKNIANFIFVDFLAFWLLLSIMSFNIILVSLFCTVIIITDY